MKITKENDYYFINGAVIINEDYSDIEIFHVNEVKKLLSSWIEESKNHEEIIRMEKDLQRLKETEEKFIFVDNSDNTMLLSKEDPEKFEALCKKKLLDIGMSEQEIAQKDKDITITGEQESVIETEEKKKYEKVLFEIEDLILYRRYESINKLNEELKVLGIRASISCSSDEHVQEIGTDHALICAINESWGYVDIYYIYDNQKRLFVTELNVSKE